MGDQPAGKRVKPPGLPSNAPAELREFVACRRMELTLDPTQLGWLPRPAMVPDSAMPTVTPTPTGANAVEVVVGWGFVSITLPVSVSGGHLQVDSSNIPDLGGLKSGIDNWVKAMNDTLDANGKQLSGMALRDGKIVVAKQAVAGAQRAAVAPALRDRAGVKVGAAVAGLLLVGAAVFVATRGDGSATSSPVAPSTTSDRSPTSEPATELATTVPAAVVCDLPDGASPGSFYSDPELRVPCEQPPADGWTACSSSHLPCFSNGPLLVIPGSSVGISHQGSVPDAITGLTGPSQATFKIAVTSPLPAQRVFLQVASLCGQDTLTGQSLIDPSGTTTVSHPLLQYGRCEVSSLSLLAEGRPPQRIPFRQTFDVGPTESAPGEPALDGFSLAGPGAFDAAGTVFGVLGDAALSPDCLWLLPPGMRSMREEIIGGCAPRYLSFDISTGDDRLIAHGGGFLNPAGILEPRPDDLLGLTSSAPFADDGMFPCGPGRVGWTVCPEAPIPLTDAGLAAVSLVTADPLMDAAIGSRYGIAFRNGLMYMAERTTDGWSLTATGPTNARVIVRGNSLTFVVPQVELPRGDVTYFVSLDGDGGLVTQPEARVVGVITTPADTPAP